MTFERIPQPGGPRLHAQTGSHECRNPPRGHFSCVLADARDERAVRAEIREKAAARQRELREQVVAR